MKKTFSYLQQRPGLTCCVQVDDGGHSRPKGHTKNEKEKESLISKHENMCVHANT